VFTHTLTSFFSGLAWPADSEATGAAKTSA